MNETLTELLNEYSEVRSRKMELEHRMAEFVIHYKGSVIEALEEGIIRLNFTAPPNFYRSIRRSK
uniref:Uncharacterized protein n=1 Tax=viral metagenome TaxID=1070528 RepID=A0A6M3IM22_9ZZZZ